MRKERAPVWFIPRVQAAGASSQAEGGGGGTGTTYRFLKFSLSLFMAGVSMASTKQS